MPKLCRPPSRFHPHPDSPRCVSCALTEPIGGGESEGEVTSPNRTESVAPWGDRKLVVPEGAGGDAGTGPGGKVAQAATGTATGLAGMSKGLGYVPPRTCGACPVDLACRPNKQAGVTCVAPRAHGGAGLILSRGLMDAVPLSKVGGRSRSAMEALI